MRKWSEMITQRSQYHKTNLWDLYSDHTDLYISLYFVSFFENVQGIIFDIF